MDIFIIGFKFNDSISGNYFMAKLAEGEDTLLEIPGIGRKILADVKRELRTRGYELPETE